MKYDNESIFILGAELELERICVSCHSKQVAGVSLTRNAIQSLPARIAYFT